MKIHRLQEEQFLPISLEKAWEFFSTPVNLDLITPDDMSFEIRSGAGEKTYAGQIIMYRIKPLLNIPMNWVTEITHCEVGRMFIDEQRFGPYKFWHHQHHFRQVDGGVLMTDILHYALPFGWLGEIMGSLFIHKRVAGIFIYRRHKLDTIFPAKPSRVAA